MRMTQRICGIFQGGRGFRRRLRSQPNLGELHFLESRRTVCSSYPPPYEGTRFLVDGLFSQLSARAPAARGGRHRRAVREHRGLRRAAGRALGDGPGDLRRRARGSARRARGLGTGPGAILRGELRPRRRRHPQRRSRGPSMHATPEPDPSSGTAAASAWGARSGASWSPERQASMFAEPRGNGWRRGTAGPGARRGGRRKVGGGRGVA